MIANGQEGFLDNTHPYPSKFLDMQQLIINPEYSLWKMYNRLIMSWLYASLSENVMTQIVGYNAAEIWLALGQIYAFASMARLIKLCT